MLVFPTTLHSDARVLEVSLTDGPDRNGNNFTNYTYVDMALGAAPSAGHTRHILAVAISDSDDSPNQSITAITYSPDGIVAYTTMTELISSHDVHSGWGYNAMISIAEFPTGTTQYFRVTTSAGTQSNMNLAIYRLIDLRSTTPVDTAASGAAGNDAEFVTLNLDVNGGGVVIMAAETIRSSPMSSLSPVTSSTFNNNESVIVGHKTLETFQDEYAVTATPVLAPPFVPTADMNFIAVSLF